MNKRNELLDELKKWNNIVNCTLNEMIKYNETEQEEAYKQSYIHYCNAVAITMEIRNDLIREENKGDDK